jgi:hypothetical protein
MARLTLIVLIATASACTVANRESQSQDSTAMKSTPIVDTTSSSGSVAEAQTTETVQDTSRLNAVYDEQLAIATGDESRYYIVSVSVSQYEGSATVTWHFDKDLTPRYFKETWSMESQEGANELMIKDGTVVCAFTSDNQSEEKWCAQTGGIRSTGEEIQTKELLPPDYSTTSKSEFERKLAILVRILKEGTITSESPDSYIVRIESTVDVGQEVTESTEVDIPKVIYEELMR